MANSLSLTAGINQARVFQCPNCKETIDTSEPQCRFCSAAIDASAAELAAEAMARVNQACSDAGFLKTVAITLPICFGLMFLPFVGWLGMWGFYILSIAAPVMAIRWWMRAGRIKTNDRDFSRARGTVVLLSVLLPFPLIFSLLSLVGDFNWHFRP